MLKRVFSIITLLCAITAHAQTNTIDEELFRGEAGFNIGLNTDGWQSDFYAAYFPFDCFGLKASLGTAAEIEEFGDWFAEDWMKSQDYAIRLKFTPAIVFRSPRLVSFREPDSGLTLFAEPGVTFAPGASGSEHPKTVCWDFRCGVNLQFGRGILIVGYEVTNFTLYSGRPLSHYASPDKDKYYTHGAYIGIGFKF